MGAPILDKTIDPSRAVNRPIPFLRTFMNETADKNDSPQRRSLAAKFLRPSWDERKRMLRIEAWVFVIASYLLLAFAYFWPPAYERQSPIYVTVAWTAFIIRIYVFHLGLVLLIIAAIALYARRAVVGNHNRTDVSRFPAQGQADDSRRTSDPRRQRLGGYAPAGEDQTRAGMDRDPSGGADCRLETDSQRRRTIQDSPPSIGAGP